MNEIKLVIFDFNKTLYDPSTQSLKLGANKLLHELNKLNYQLVLLSTDSSDRKELIDSLGITSYFSHIEYVNQKTESDIKQIMKKFDASANNTLIIGDNPAEELLIGIKLNIKVIAVASGLASYEQAIHLGAAYCQNLEEVLYEITGTN